jgi:hypothetical protein
VLDDDQCFPHTRTEPATRERAHLRQPIHQRARICLPQQTCHASLPVRPPPPHHPPSHLRPRPPNRPPQSPSPCPCHTSTRVTPSPARAVTSLPPRPSVALRSLVRSCAGSSPPGARLLVGPSPWRRARACRGVYSSLICRGRRRLRLGVSNRTARRGELSEEERTIAILSESTHRRSV